MSTVDLVHLPKVVSMPEVTSLPGVPSTPPHALSLAAMQPELLSSNRLGGPELSAPGAALSVPVPAVPSPTPIPAVLSSPPPPAPAPSPGQPPALQLAPPPLPPVPSSPPPPFSPSPPSPPSPPPDDLIDGSIDGSIGGSIDGSIDGSIGTRPPPGLPPPPSSPPPLELPLAPPPPALWPHLCTAYDGYLSGCALGLDANADGVLDAAEEPVGLTDVHGFADLRASAHADDATVAARLHAQLASAAPIAPPTGEPSSAALAARGAPLFVLAPAAPAPDASTAAQCVDAYTGLNGSAELYAPLAPLLLGRAERLVLSPLSTLLVLSRALEAGAEGGPLGVYSYANASAAVQGAAVEAAAIELIEARVRAWYELPPLSAGAPWPVLEWDPLRALWAGEDVLAASAALRVSMELSILGGVAAALLEPPPAAQPESAGWLAPSFRGPERGQWLLAEWWVRASTFGTAASAVPGRAPELGYNASAVAALLSELVSSPSAAAPNGTVAAELLDAVSLGVSTGLGLLADALAEVRDTAGGGGARRRLQGADLASVLSSLARVQRAIQGPLTEAIRAVAAQVRRVGAAGAAGLSALVSTYGSVLAFSDVVAAQVVPAIASPFNAPPPSAPPAGAEAGGGGDDDDDDVGGGPLAPGLGLDEAAVPLGVIIAISVGGGLLLCCAVALLLRRARAKRSSTAADDPAPPPPPPPRQEEAEGAADGDAGDGQPTPRAMAKPPGTRPHAPPAAEAIARPPPPPDPLAVLAGARAAGSVRIWRAHRDDARDAWYYEERTSGTVTWDPRQVWTAFPDARSSRFYFFNEASGETSWTDPRSVPQLEGAPAVVVLEPAAEQAVAAVLAAGDAQPGAAALESAPPPGYEDGTVAAGRPPPGRRVMLPPIPGDTVAEPPPLPEALRARGESAAPLPVPSSAGDAAGAPPPLLPPSMPAEPDAGPEYPAATLADAADGSANAAGGAYAFSESGAAPMATPWSAARERVGAFWSGGGAAAGAPSRWASRTQPVTRITPTPTEPAATQPRAPTVIDAARAARVAGEADAAAGGARDGGGAQRRPST